MMTRLSAWHILGASMFIAAAEGAGGENDDLYDANSALVILTTIVILSLIFEFLEHKALKKSHPTTRPIIHALFAELTVLGFLALVTFSCIKGNVFTNISTTYWGDSQHLLHLFEDIHFSMFGMMVFFFGGVGTMIYRANVLKHEWKAHEYACIPKLGQLIEENYAEMLQEGRGNVPWWKCDPGAKEARGHIEYFLLRHRFISTAGHVDTKLPPLENDFDFAEYLSRRMVEIAIGIVNVPFWMWIILQVVFLFAYLAMRSSTAVKVSLYFLVTVLQGASYLAMLWEINVVYKRIMVDPVEWLQWKDYDIGDGVEQGGKGKVHPTHDPLVQEIPEAEKFDVDMDVQAAEAVVEESAVEGAAVEGNAEQCLKRAKTVREERRTKAQVYDGPVPQFEVIGKLSKKWNKHEDMMWGKQYGEIFHQAHIRAVLLFSAVQFAFFRWMFFVLWDDVGSKALAIIFIIIQAALLFLLPSAEVLRKLTIITSVEKLKSKKIVLKVQRVSKTRRHTRTLKLLTSIKSLWRKESLLAGPIDEEAGAGASPASLKKSKTKKRVTRLKSKSNTSARGVEDQLLADLQETFTLFDADGNGYVEASELAELLQSLGERDVTSCEIDQLMQEMDLNEDGKIGWDEFASAIMARRAQEDMQLSPEDYTELLFHLIDHDSDGLITVQEFQSVLNKLHADLTTEDVEELVRDMDTDGDGRINVKELADMILREAQ